jgi:dTDP-glucose 4,6-dehydratase
MNLLVTGGCGFIGSNFINHRIDQYNDNIVNIDSLTYAGNTNNVYRESVWTNTSLPAEPEGVYRHMQADINYIPGADFLFKDNQFDAVIHFAAESHVDRSIDDPGVFIQTNVVGTYELLEVYRRYSKEGCRFVHVSTDEVYGDLTEDEPAFTEDSIIKPNSPYAASKASSDLLCRSYHETYKLPIMITRCSNNYGPNQHPEKLIPLMIQNALEGKKLGVYGDGKNIRDWIHVLDHCRGVSRVMYKGIPGEVYNLGGEHEVRNIDIVKNILDILEISHDRIEFIEDRKGHDWRYAMDVNKARIELGWHPTVDFNKSLESLINHYAQHHTHNVH